MYEYEKKIFKIFGIPFIILILGMICIPFIDKKIVPILTNTKTETFEVYCTINDLEEETYSFMVGKVPTFGKRYYSTLVPTESENEYRVSITASQYNTFKIKDEILCIMTVEKKGDKVKDVDITIK